MQARPLYSYSIPFVQLIILGWQDECLYPLCAGTAGPRIVAATPHAEVVIAEPTQAPATPASQAYIPCKASPFFNP